MRPFRQWAQGHYAPIILVVSTPAAEALCQKSGLSVVDIFRPFSVTNPNGTLLASAIVSPECALVCSKAVAAKSGAELSSCTPVPSLCSANSHE